MSASHKEESDSIREHGLKKKPDTAHGEGLERKEGEQPKRGNEEQRRIPLPCRSPVIEGLWEG